MLHSKLVGFGFKLMTLGADKTTPLHEYSKKKNSGCRGTTVDRIEYVSQSHDAIFLN